MSLFELRGGRSGTNMQRHAKSPLMPVRPGEEEVVNPKDIQLGEIDRREKLVGSTGGIKFGEGIVLRDGFALRKSLGSDCRP